MSFVGVVSEYRKVNFVKNEGFQFFLIVLSCEEKKSTIVLSCKEKKST